MLVFRLPLIVFPLCYSTSTYIYTYTYIYIYTPRKWRVDNPFSQSSSRPQALFVTSVNTYYRQHKCKSLESLLLRFCLHLWIIPSRTDFPAITAVAPELNMKEVKAWSRDGVSCSQMEFIFNPPVIYPCSILSSRYGSARHKSPLLNSNRTFTIITAISRLTAMIRTRTATSEANQPIIGYCVDANNPSNVTRWFVCRNSLKL